MTANAERSAVDIICLTKEGMKASEITKILGLGVASVYRHKAL
tara:strand:- start:466 stop:594 length:129 start_codon:yes stop_codon:yes gene_type:complete